MAHPPGAAGCEQGARCGIVPFAGMCCISAPGMLGIDAMSGESHGQGAAPVNAVNCANTSAQVAPARISPRNRMAQRNE
jgi:hypothetical protein